MCNSSREVLKKANGFGLVLGIYVFFFFKEHVSYFLPLQLEPSLKIL